MLILFNNLTQLQFVKFAVFVTRSKGQPALQGLLNISFWSSVHTIKSSEEVVVLQVLQLSQGSLVLKAKGVFWQPLEYSRRREPRDSRRMTMFQIVSFFN